MEPFQWAGQLFYSSMEHALLMSSFSCHETILCCKDTNKQQLLVWSYQIVNRDSGLVVLAFQSCLQNDGFEKISHLFQHVTKNLSADFSLKTISHVQNWSNYSVCGWITSVILIQFSNDLLPDLILTQTETIISWLVWLSDYDLIWD